MLKHDALSDFFGDSFELEKASAALSSIFDTFGFNNVGLFFAPVDIQFMSAEPASVVVCNARSNTRPIDGHVRSSLKAILQAVAEQRASMFPHYWDASQNKWIRLRSIDVLKNDKPVILGIFSLDSVGELIGFVVETTKAVAMLQMAAFHHHALLVLDKVIELRRVDLTSILTESERNVLSWCANGKTSYEISKILDLSEHTVNHYLANVCRKLHATNRAQATAKAIKLGILPISFIH
ncbi:response regulator transcription factor [Ahrensia kielensis]|uniref:response regulator transcription factor n=1 Tax=Ahrensia kielensis TaxID=76980 RepID=UPI000373CB5F|nr:LuxR C-terminal-related transcriptional regulator [Ahrensia kielensis]